MQKPANWDGIEAKSFSHNERPEPGAYIMRIESAAETTSQKGRPMLVLCLDIAEGKYAGNFRKLFTFFKEKNSEAKWPLVHRRCTDGGQEAYFKGDIKAIEESNSGFKFNFDEKTLNKKLVGAMLREKEIGTNQDGSPKFVLECAYLCSVEKVKSGILKPMAAKAMERQPEYSYNGGNPEYSEEPMPF